MEDIFNGIMNDTGCNLMGQILTAKYLVLQVFEKALSVLGIV
jgi:hypothetical protein